MVVVCCLVTEIRNYDVWVWIDVVVREVENLKVIGNFVEWSVGLTSCR